jgi:hypothetical protein
MRKSSSEMREITQRNFDKMSRPYDLYSYHALEVVNGQTIVAACTHSGLHMVSLIPYDANAGVFPMPWFGIEDYKVVRARTTEMLWI